MAHRALLQCLKRRQAATLMVSSSSIFILTFAPAPFPDLADSFAVTPSLFPISSSVFQNRHSARSDTAGFPAPGVERRAEFRRSSSNLLLLFQLFVEAYPAFSSATISAMVESVSPMGLVFERRRRDRSFARLRDYGLAASPSFRSIRHPWGRRPNSFSNFASARRMCNNLSPTCTGNRMVLD